MNKGSIKIMASMLMISMALFSCVKKSGSAISDSDGATGSDIGNYEIYEEFKTGSSAYYCEGDSTFGDSVKVYTTASISVQWPRRFGDADVSALQDTILAHTFETPKASVDSCIVDFLSRPLGYGEGVLVKVDEVPYPDENNRVLSTNISVKTVGFCEKYVVFKIEHDEYAGGAHPNYFASFVNYDLKNKRVLTYATLFKENSEEGLLPILQQAMLDNYYCKTVEELEEKSGVFADDLFVSHEVYLTGDEVVFFYNPYDIGPWAIGTVEVPVPVSMLSEYLSEYGKALYDL